MDLGDSWGAVTIYVFYLGVFAGTKYHLNADGIYTDSFISRYSKNFSWNEATNIEETVLAYTNRGRGNCGVYYIIATSEDVERERGLLERMKCEEIICVPVTKKLKSVWHIMRKDTI